MKGIFAILLFAIVTSLAAAEEGHKAFDDGVLTCQEMHKDPYGIFSEDVFLGSGQFSPLDVEYDCDGSLASLPFLTKYLALAESIRSEKGPRICTGTLLYVHNRLYFYALLEAGLAPKNLLARARRGISPAWAEYFESWGHKSPFNFGLYRAFLEEERVVRSKLSTYYEKKYGLAQKKAAAIADAAIEIVKDRAAGSFPGSSGSYTDEKLPLVAKLVIAGEQNRAKLSPVVQDSSQEDLDVALKGALLHEISDVIIELLLSKIVEIDQGDESALFFALKNQAIIDALLKRGANINYENGFGKTPLYYAIENGNLEILEHLLKNGADPNHRYVSKEDLESNIFLLCEYAIVHPGRTPLMHAAQHGTRETISMLVKYGGRINDVDDVSFSALDYAAHNAKPDNATYLQTLGAKSGCKTGNFAVGECMESNTSPTSSCTQPNLTLDSGSVREPSSPFDQFPSPHATMERQAGPILETWAGQALLAE